MIKYKSEKQDSQARLLKNSIRLMAEWRTMTLKQVESEVLGLMFEEEFDNASAFYDSLNRAMAQIATERDLVSEHKIYKPNLIPKELTEHIHHRSDESIKLDFKCKALSFTLNGKGKVLFTDGKTVFQEDFSGGTNIVKKIASSGSLSVEFKGEYDYDIINLATYSFLLSESTQDVESYSQYKEYDIKKSDPLFISFISMPRNEINEIIEEVQISGSIIKIPISYEGFINIRYKKRPEFITPSDYDKNLDVSRECEHLLALLTAAYLLSDDNRELSAYYMTLYRDGISAVKLYNRVFTGVAYKDVLGWAK